MNEHNSSRNKQNLKTYISFWLQTCGRLMGRGGGGSGGRDWGQAWGGWVVVGYQNRWNGDVQGSTQWIYVVFHGDFEFVSGIF